jgi:hypothetical protein
MGTPPPDDRYVVRAYELFCEGKSLRDIQQTLPGEFEEMGPIGSHETIRRWIKKGQIIVAWLREDAKDDFHTDAAFIRAKYATFLDDLITMYREEISRGGAKVQEVGPLMLNAAKEQARALGAYAPTRLQHEGSGSPLPPELPPGMQSLAEAFRRREEELLSGDTES